MTDDVATRLNRDMSSLNSHIQFDWGKYDASLLRAYMHELASTIKEPSSESRVIGHTRSLLLSRKDVSTNQMTSIGGVNIQTYHDYALIDLLWIEPEFRKQGYGRMLVERVESYAKDLGLKRLLLSAYEHHNSVEFWKKMGCEEVGRIRDYPAGEQLVYLHKRLV